MRLAKIIIISSWASTSSLIVLYISYLALFSIGKADTPIGENMSLQSIYIGCSLVIVVPSFMLWLSRRYNLNYMKEGYNRGSEIFFCFLALVFSLTMLRMFYLQFFPAISFM